MDRVCQFYIVVGEKDFRPPNDGNVYINATGVMDNNLIQDAIYRAFHKKHNEKVQVGKIIIFLVSDMSLEPRCNEIMNALGINGKVEVLPKKVESKVVEEIVPVGLEKEEVVSENTSIDSSVNNAEVVRKDDKIVNMEEYQRRFQKQEDTVSAGSNVSENKEVAKYSYQPENHIYYGDFDNSLTNKGSLENGVSMKDSASYMGYNPSLVNKNVKTLVKKQQRPKSAAFVHLPVIIFVLSALLLIASIILLFVLE